MSSVTPVKPMKSDLKLLNKTLQEAISHRAATQCRYRVTVYSLKIIDLKCQNSHRRPKVIFLMGHFVGSNLQHSISNDTEKKT